MEDKLARDNFDIDFTGFWLADPEKVFNVPRILKQAFSMFLNFLGMILLLK